mmetsp:Transcript_11817/g.25190  ORF Transcript_11817/g.25190 Transcript_11817/m.25190 type:complete len:207 (+) Transcript_11817:2073-2693(+)
MCRLLLRKLLPDILENTIRQCRRCTLIHEAIQPAHPRHLAPGQKRPALRIGIIPRNRHHPISRHTIGGVAVALRRSLLRGNGPHVLDHHTRHGLDGDGLLFPREADGDGNAVGTAARVGVGDALVGAFFHLFLSERIGVREADEALDVGDGVFVVGEGGGGGGFAHGAGLVEAYHVGIQTLRVPIENDVHATPSGGGNDAMLSAKV